MVEESSSPTFDELKSHIRELKSPELLGGRVDYLRTFWADKGFFYSNRESKKEAGEEPNVTSTAFCTLALLEDTEFLSSFSSKVSDEGDTETDLLRKIGEQLLNAEWSTEDLGKYNTYTTPIALTVLYEIEEAIENRERSGLDLETSDQVLEGAQVLLKEGFYPELPPLEEGSSRTAPPAGVRFVDPDGGNDNGEDDPTSHPRYGPQGFLTYWSYRAFERMLVCGVPNDDDGIVSEEKLEMALESMRRWARNELRQQLALESAGDSSQFDVFEMAYASAICCRNPQLIDEDLPEANEKIIKRALRTFFSDQLDDGLWPKCSPIFHDATRGDFYSFTFEVLDVFLTHLQGGESRRPFALADRHQIITRVLPNIKRAIQWAQDNLSSETTTELRGWRSNHVPETFGPEAWSTASVLMTLKKFEILISDLREETVLDKFQATVDTEQSLESQLDSDLPTGDGEKSLINYFREEVIRPRNDGTSDGKSSIVLFGPPGTGKTELAKITAKELEWDFVPLRSGDLLQKGFDHVASQIKYIFERLKALDKAVILFDEPDEFMRNRDEARAYSRMITTDMLTHINDLTSSADVIFMVATNRLSDFDPAIRRPGRFDDLILVGPPNMDSKKEYLPKKVDLDEVDEEILDKVRDWTDEQDDLRYFTFREWDDFCDSVHDIIRGNTSWDDIESELDRELKARRSSMTITGEIRRKYDGTQADRDEEDDTTGDDTPMTKLTRIT